MATLMDRLRKLRREHKLTQKDVADFLGISESAYGYYEQGRNEPSLDAVKKLAKRYNVSTSYILGEGDKPYPDKINEGLAFFDGGENLTEEEKEYLKESLELFRKMRAKREKE